jgi:hypothetical protein
MKRWGWSVALVLALFAEAAATAEAADPAAALRARYESLQPVLQKNHFGAPFYIESQDRDGRMHGRVYGVLDHDFRTLRATLVTPAGWCELVPLHLNIKGCRHRPLGAHESEIMVYTGDKKYTPIENTTRSDYVLRTLAASASYLNIKVTSDIGPLDTGDYRLQVEAIPLSGGRTFAHVSFSYRYGAAMRMLSAVYFGTVARAKEGFSIVGQDTSGAPVFVRGRAAALERNVMRLYLALLTVLEARAKPEAERFDWSIRRWHALTERYRRQLHELDEAQYLDAKRRERAEQLRAGHELWPAPAARP